MESDTPRFLWGAKAIAEFFGIPEAEVFYRHSKRQLPGVTSVPNGRGLVGEVARMTYSKEDTAA
jgi:hypothetical protein